MISFKHVLSQGPVLRAMAVAAVVRPRSDQATAPGPWIESTLAPRPRDLVRDYLRAIGADPSWYRGRVPPHMFPQWGFPLAAKAMAGLPYPMTRVLNAGCRIEVNGVIADDLPLRVRARLESLEVDERKALITTRIETNDVVVASLRAFVPLRRGGGKGQPSLVPNDAREIAFLRIPADAGLDFAKVTGDFNPIHWVPAAARAAGFRGCILHGFATMARAITALDRTLFAGDPTRLQTFDARFTRPLVMPARVGVYVNEDRVWVGDAPGGGAYLEGTFK
jgi:hypothetical protein